MMMLLSLTHTHTFLFVKKLFSATNVVTNNIIIFFCEQHILLLRLHGCPVHVEYKCFKTTIVLLFCFCIYLCIYIWRYTLLILNRYSGICSKYDVRLHDSISASPHDYCTIQQATVTSAGVSLIFLIIITTEYNV